MVRADHGAVDHLDAVWRCAAIVEGIEHQFPKSGQGPAPELAIHARPLAELFRQITPGSTGSSNPENAIENKAVVGGRATALPPDRYQKGFKECPLGILHQQPRQDNLRKSYLESHLAAIVNPVCQQGLVSVIQLKAMVSIERRGRIALGDTHAKALCEISVKVSS